MTTEYPARWPRRFEHFEKCLALLREAVALAGSRPLSELEKAGLIQRYEIAWELGWKTLSDYLRETEEPGLPFTSGSSIRLAAAMRLIGDGDAWLSAGKLRNTLSHEYSEEKRDEGLLLIRSTFLPMMEQLHQTMVSRVHAA